MAFTVLPYGPHAALIECDNQSVLTIAAAARASRSFREVIPAERSVLVTFAFGTSIEDVEGIARTAPDVAATITPREHLIPVDYNGVDLELVAEALGLDVEDVVEAHSSAVYTAGFPGFMPGFMYLYGLPEQLTLPRRPVGRTTVPAGSVVIGDLYAAVYPAAGPGGWHVLGQTDVPLLDPRSAEPALIIPGDRVRFVVRSA